VRIPGTYGKTLLHIAARRNFVGLCRWLLWLGANVNRTDILDRTALHYAAQQGAMESAQLLIAHGANLDAKDWKGRTPLDFAETEGSDLIVREIRERISLRHASTVKAVRVARTDKSGAAR
jgi:ankyrin repeat protein